MMVELIAWVGAFWVLSKVFAPKRSHPTPTVSINVRPNPEAIYPSDYDALIQSSAQAFNLDPALIGAIIYVESTGNANAVGDNGKSFGLMQIQYGTAVDMGYQGTPEGLLKPSSSIFFGSKYLRHQIDRWGDEMGVLAYNTGTPIRAGQIFDPNHYRRKVFSAYLKFKGVV